MIDINKIIFYGRYYDDEKNLYDISWWLCLDDYKVYHTETLMTDYSYKSIFEIEQTSKFIPFFKTDIIKLEKEFMKDFNNKVFNKILLDNNNSYDIAFRIFIERGFLIDSWSDFEKSHLQKDAISWCKKNHIPYRQ